MDTDDGVYSEREVGLCAIWTVCFATMGEDIAL